MSNPFEDLKGKANRKKKSKPSITYENKKKKKNNTTQNTTPRAQKEEVPPMNKQHNTIKIEKKIEKDKIRRNFYIQNNLDKELNKLSKKTNKSKSELVDIALENLINNIEIQ